MNATINRKLMAAGSILFFMGLITGFVIPLFENSRMGLAGHLEGVMNGTFLLAVGAVWGHLILSARLQAIAFWLLLYGTYANWLFVLAAAIFGTSEMTPIAGVGYKGLPWQETIVTLGLMTVGVTMVVGCAILIVGFVRHRKIS